MIGVESPDRIISVRPRDEGAQLFFRQFIGAGIAAVIHQRDEGRLAVGLLVGKRKVIAEGAVDEFRGGVGIEQHDADVVDLIQRRRRAFRGRMMLTLPRECIRQLAPKPRQPWRR